MQTIAQPNDVHNRTWIDNVRPGDWVNPTPSGRYNLLVVGGGPAGLVAAAGAAGLGAKVALVEKHLLGGDCLNVGCVPSKALIRAARAAAAASTASDFGVRISGEVSVDFPAVMERMRRLRASIAPHDSATRYRDELGVDVYLGAGRFTGSDTFEIDGRTIRFSKACIATGARAALPPIPGLAEVDPLTNETLFGLTELPKRFSIIGAGPIGCEMAQAFTRFGSRVTLLEAGDRILGRADSDASATLHRIFESEGIRIVTGAKIRHVEGGSGGTARILLTGEGKEESIEADRILVAAGRAPNIEDLGLESAGVSTDGRRGIEVDDRLRTANPRIFAAGDVCSKYQFTHTADFQARLVLRNALFPFGRARNSSLVVPWCIYTDPEVAHVGMDPAEASRAGIEVRTFREDLPKVDRAVLDGETDGFVKIHVKAGTDRIVGATMVSAHAGESIGELSLAIRSGAGLGTVADTIHPYPTQAEAIRRVGDTFNRTRLTPTVKRWMGKWLAWRR